MFKINFKNEVQLFKRNRILHILSIIMFIMVFFSMSTGKEKIQSRNTDIQNEMEELKSYDASLIKKFKQKESGEKLEKPWELGASYISSYRGAVSYMPSKELSFIAIGQSDIYTHQKKVSSYGTDVILDLTELSNPTQLYFGSFDLSFTLIYLLPLLIIAFSYNIVSESRENGTLSLVLSQPLNITTWLSHRVCIRLFIICTIVFTSIFINLIVFNEFQFSLSLFCFLLITFVYILFWFSLSFFINLKRYNSVMNAFILFTIWIVTVFIIPNLINNYINNFHPLPSHAKMLNEIRLTQAKLDKVKDATLQNFLENHPELIDETNTDFGFFQKYVASKKQLKKELTQIVHSYELLIEKRDKMAQMLSLLSPTALLQEAYEEIAGTSLAHYKNYKKQHQEFSEAWLNFFIPYIFKQTTFTKETLTHLPTFTYQTFSRWSVIYRFLTVVLLYIGVIVFYEVKREKKRNIEELLFI